MGRDGRDGMDGCTAMVVRGRKARDRWVRILIRSPCFTAVRLRGLQWRCGAEGVVNLGLIAALGVGGGVLLRLSFS